MRVLHISFAASGGAGVAAGRSVLALQQAGVDAQLITANDFRRPRWTRLRAKLDAYPLRFYNRRRLFSEWSNNWMPSLLAPRIKALAPDIIHVHWAGAGFLGIADLKAFGVPIVWTMHDAWPFTGGCHYPANCSGFRSRCGCCPQLSSRRSADLSRFNFNRKQRIRSQIQRWISPSRWLADLASDAGIPADRTRVVPNGVDGGIYTPAHREMARHELGLAEADIVLLAGAHDLTERRKGAGIYQIAVSHIRSAVNRRCVAYVFGSNASQGMIAAGISTVGVVSGDLAVARLLSAADVLLLPSLQDNLPNIAVEAQACGLPVVGFDSGGLREIVHDSVTGRLVSAFEASALARATVEWLNGTDRGNVSVLCRSRFERHFQLGSHAANLVAVYQELVKDGRAT